MKKQKSQSKRIPLKLKSQILNQILLPGAFIPKIAKQHNVSPTTLYGWRINHNKKINQNLKNNFIELLPEEESLQKEDLISNKTLPSIPISKSNNSKLSEISLIFNSNISLSLKGNINSSSLIKIINCLGEELC